MAPSRSIRRRLANFVAMEPGLKLMVLEAVLALLLARLALQIVPFARLSHRFGEFVPPQDPRIALRRKGDDASVRIAAQVRRAVHSATRHVPFKAVCLPQAMAAQAMLRRRGIASVMHFGAGFGESRPLDAHAWLDAAGVPVTGYPPDPKFSEIACFV